MRCEQVCDTLDAADVEGSLRSRRSPVTNTDDTSLLPLLPRPPNDWEISRIEQSKKHVTITYTPLDPAKPDGAVTRFDDVVEYYSLSSPASHKRTRIAGVDTLTDPPTLFKWCGSGLLTPITSRWQPLGVDAASQEWAVTFFESTLFSPAGIDVYERGLGGAAEDVLREIKEGLREVCGETAKLAEQLFEVQQERGGQS